MVLTKADIWLVSIVLVLGFLFASTLFIKTNTLYVEEIGRVDYERGRADHIELLLERATEELLYQIEGYHNSPLHWVELPE